MTRKTGHKKAKGLIFFRPFQTKVATVLQCSAQQSPNFQPKAGNWEPSAKPEGRTEPLELCAL